MNLSVSTKHMELFECLASSTRIKILESLFEGPKNIGELANLLGISPAIVTRHIAKMEKAGLVRTESLPGKRGLQKLCHAIEQSITLQFSKRASDETHKYHLISIPIGQYSAYEVTPTCGLASTRGLIGMCDDPRYFSAPDRFEAAILWFASGYVEYRIPSYVLWPPSLRSISISMEICSEYPVYNETWPSDIHFYLDDVLLGVWTCPGDFGKQRGVYTPEWWNLGTQHGLLKTICVTKEGTMLDGVRLSDVALDQIPIAPGKDLRFRIAAPPDAERCGGVNLFGRGFGNYDQDIEVRTEYQTDPNQA
ncbi:MAG TPA: ArsR family transcriptional regulator [Bacillota bacterium]|mgnify:FL=1|nr:ArsR family transcriptional regulator [Bacillota bacterium]